MKMTRYNLWGANRSAIVVPKNPLTTRENNRLCIARPYFVERAHVTLTLEYNLLKDSVWRHLCGTEYGMPLEEGFATR